MRLPALAELGTGRTKSSATSIKRTWLAPSQGTLPEMDALSTYT